MTGQQNPYAGLTSGGAGEPPLMSSGISFSEDELDRAGRTISSQVEVINALQTKSGGLPVPWPHFGVYGMGVNSVHDSAVDSQVSALSKAREALDSWDPALRKADANYRQAEKDSGDQFDTDRFKGGSQNGNWPGGGGGSMPEFPTDSTKSLKDLKLPDDGLDGLKRPGDGSDDFKLPGDGKKPSDDLDLPVDRDKLPTDRPDAPQQPDLPKQPELPKQPDLSAADGSGVGKADTRIPDLDSALNRPSTKTDLSSYQPPAAQLPSTTGLPSADTPGTVTRTGPSALGAGPMTSSGAGGAGTGVAGLLSGQRAAGVPGMGGMPMMPFMGGGGGANAEDRERDKSVLMPEDEGVWGGEEDVAPQIIGEER
ncbi:hypothetical protein HII36_45730 [Nonomuraea sp. NN258]|uniref:hypothetical protein n=1 Tax=Nonomuraea antri TaxID=2730852 RepID=UPI00156A1082|nr:hypothetical protein [Nonomuraea antri]NRQ39076.1 hypothetical protein [Nonomuraea antri]